MSFIREAFRPRGGPDGGNGGRGGDVILRASHHMSTLVHLQGKRKLAARNGVPGGGENMDGANGEHLVIDLPPGTLVRDSEGKIIADLKEGEITLLQGGRGGKGNTFFKSSINQTPTHFQKGEEGQSIDVSFELRLIADIGVIGFPNAGKSTLVSVVTSAKPKIADYPFTTLNPQLGVVKMDDANSFTIADIPGLIEGASEGIGLGHQFLQHIMRTKAFVHLLDVSDFSGRDVLDDYLKINQELRKYDELRGEEEGYETLSSRQQIVVFNKIDSASPERLEDLRSLFAKEKISVLEISAASRKNVDQLVSAMCDQVFRSESDE